MSDPLSKSRATGDFRGKQPTVDHFVNGCRFFFPGASVHTGLRAADGAPPAAQWAQCSDVLCLWRGSRPGGTSRRDGYFGGKAGDDCLPTFGG
jgi:hypothetical protein